MKKIILLVAITPVFAFGAVMVIALLLIAFWPERRPRKQTDADKDAAAEVKDPMEELKSAKKGLRVLFVGNSHTATNNLPDLVTKLAQAANVDRPLLAWSESPGGTSFQMHWENGRVQKLLTEVKWDLVVLQDQSNMPNLPRDEREKQTRPFARKLDQKIRESGARTLLFMTWGYQDGFFPMQKRARDAYQDLAGDLEADLVPIGTAWEKALKARPNLDLWFDGNHATMKGTYLAACVFHAVFYGNSPLGNSFTAGLDAGDSRFLQETAASVVVLEPGGFAAKARGQ